MCISNHSCEINTLPESDIALVGNPKVETHPLMKAEAQFGAVAAVMGTAVKKRLVRSKTVSKYLWPSDGAIGPTTSIWRSLKRGARVGLGSIGGVMTL